MKSLKILRLFFLSATLVLASPLIPEVRASVATETPAEQAARMQNRLEEIKAMDVSQMSRQEKRELRKEVRAIKKEMAALSGGLYLSIGAIIIILLLIILLV